MVHCHCPVALHEHLLQPSPAGLVCPGVHSIAGQARLVHAHAPLTQVHVLQPSFLVPPSAHPGGATHEPWLSTPVPSSAAMQALSYVFWLQPHTGESC